MILISDSASEALLLMVLQPIWLDSHESNEQYKEEEQNFKTLLKWNDMNFWMIEVVAHWIQF